MRTIAALIGTIGIWTTYVYVSEFWMKKLAHFFDLRRDLITIRRFGVVSGAILISSLITRAFFEDWISAVGEQEVERAREWAFVVLASSFTVLVSAVYTLRRHRDSNVHVAVTRGSIETLPSLRQRLSGTVLSVISLVSGILGIIAFYLDFVRAS